MYVSRCDQPVYRSVPLSRHAQKKHYCRCYNRKKKVIRAKSRYGGVQIFKKHQERSYDRKKENNANDIVDVVCIIFFFPIITPPLMCFFILSEPTISGCNLHYSLFSYNNSSLNVFFPIGTYNMWMLFTLFSFFLL